MALNSLTFEIVSNLTVIQIRSMIFFCNKGTKSKKSEKSSKKIFINTKKIEKIS